MEPGVFCVHELMEAAATANTKASTSPLDPIPVGALIADSEVVRACVLGVINAAYAWRCLPWLWRKVPIAPVPKPGKSPASFDGYRSIYLLAGAFKLYDRMLFNRVRKHVRSASEPLQAGGAKGADHATWILDAVLRARAQISSGKKTWVAAFLDAEAGYCRPHRAVILRGLGKAGVSFDDQMAIRSILMDIRGCVKINGTIIGDWIVEAGAPQGGALSTPLFQSILPELERELRKAGCGVAIGRHGGEQSFISCLGYVDDLAILASSAKMLRRALKIAHQWAQRVRIRWNVGPNKSAVMLWGWGKCPSSTADVTFKLGRTTLPRVSSYRYLGSVLSCGGGWSANVIDLRSKCARRTKEVQAWCSQRCCPTTLADRLWRLYVQPAVLHGIGTMKLTESKMASLDIGQRQAGRTILGFLPRSPSPAIPRRDG